MGRHKIKSVGVTTNTNKLRMGGWKEEVIKQIGLVVTGEISELVEAEKCGDEEEDHLVPNLAAIYTNWD